MTLTRIKWKYGRVLTGALKSVEREKGAEVAVFEADTGQGIDDDKRLFLLCQAPTSLEAGLRGKITFQEGGPFGGHWVFST